MASMVPSAEAQSVDTVEITSVLRSAEAVSALSNRRAYQPSVNPVHCALNRDSLNEYTTSTTTGAYRNTIVAQNTNRGRKLRFTAPPRGHARRGATESGLS